MNSYHNTTDMVGEQLQRYQDKALSQDERVLAYFEANYDSLGIYLALPPTAIRHRVFGCTVPITSVRRALTNLTTAGKLRTSGMETGPYGRAQHRWRLVEKDPQREMGF